MGKQTEIKIESSSLTTEEKAMIKAYEEVKARGGKLYLDKKQAQKVFQKLQTKLW